MDMSLKKTSVDFEVWCPKSGAKPQHHRKNLCETMQPRWSFSSNGNREGSVRTPCAGAHQTRCSQFAEFGTETNNGTATGLQQKPKATRSKEVRAASTNHGS